MANNQYTTYCFSGDMTTRNMVEALQSFVKRNYDAETEISEEAEMYYMDIYPPKCKKPQLYIHIIDKGNKCELAMSHNPMGRRDKFFSTMAVAAIPFYLPGAIVLGGFWGMSQLNRNSSFKRVKKQISDFIEDYLK